MQSPLRMVSTVGRAMRGSFSHNGPVVHLSSAESRSLNLLPAEYFVVQPFLAVRTEVGREPWSLQVRKMEAPSGCQWGRLRRKKAISQGRFVDCELSACLS